MTIAEQLVKLNDTKQGIKSAIEAKGVPVGDAPFAEYPEKIAAIDGGGGDATRWGFSLDNLLPTIVNGSAKRRQLPREINVSGLQNITDSSTAFSYLFYCVEPASEGTVCTFPDLVNMTTNRALEYLFSADNVHSTSPGLSVSFPALETIGAWYGFTYFAYRGSVTEVDFPVLKTLSTSYVFNNAFNNSKPLKKINYPLLENTNTCGFYQAFYETSVEAADFPSLQTIENNGFSGAFNGCTSLQTASFPSLTTIAASGMVSCFQAKSSDPGIMKQLSFPSLTDIATTAFGSSESSYAFRYRTTLEEIHFRADAREAVEATIGYADKWGATNATIYFDL